MFGIMVSNPKRLRGRVKFPTGGNPPPPGMAGLSEASPTAPAVESGEIPAPTATVRVGGD